MICRIGLVAQEKIKQNGASFQLNISSVISVSQFEAQSEHSSSLGSLILCGSICLPNIAE